MIGRALEQALNGSTSAHNISPRDLAHDIHETHRTFLGLIEIWLESDDERYQKAAQRLLQPVSIMHDITANPQDW